MSRKDRKRFYYAIDRGHRNKRRNQAGRKTKLPETRASWSRIEMEAILGIGRNCLTRMIRLGLVPAPTYPYPPNKHRFWNHQALLLVRLFEEMRKEGWPKRMPHFVGSDHWTEFLTKLRSEWGEEPDDLRKWKARCGDDHPEGKDNAGECAGV